jgi:hypothetical protein
MAFPLSGLLLGLEGGLRFRASRANEVVPFILFFPFVVFTYLTRGLERAVHLIKALPSLIMALVVGYRWHLAFSGAMGAETHP